MNPTRFAPITRYTNRVISETPYVKILSDVRFVPAPWPDCLDGVGQWIALAQVNETLALIEVTVRWEVAPHA